MLRPRELFSRMGAACGGGGGGEGPVRCCWDDVAEEKRDDRSILGREGDGVPSFGLGGKSAAS